MITGALIGFLIAVVYTLITGKLQLTKRRFVYGLPARIVALVSLIPLIGAILYMLWAGQAMSENGRLGALVGGLVISIIVLYAIAWPLGEAPRQ